MLREAVLLDAAMSVSETLGRLARHGYWREPRSPEAQVWLEEFAARTRDAAARRGARASAPTARAKGSAVSAGGRTVDPSTMTADDAAEVLARPLGTARVVIRRQAGVTLFWYAQPVQRVLDTLANVPGNVPLVDALNLHETDAAPAEQATALGPDGIDRFSGVVLHGLEPLGVAEQLLPNLSHYGGATRGGRDVTLGVGERAMRGAREAAPAVEVRAHPFLDAPQTIDVGAPFDLVIGLAPEKVPGVVSTGELVLRAPAGTTVIPVEVHVVAEGFDAPLGWKHTLAVSVAKPTEARVRVRLAAQPQDEPVRLTSLLVTFSVGGVTCGTAARHIIVERSPGAAPALDDRGAFWLDAEPRPAGLAIGADPPPVDVVVDIVKPDANAAKGSYRCVLRNAHGVPVPDEPLQIDLGDDAKTFAKELIEQVRLWSGDSMVDNLLESLGALVASKLPAPFWDMLRAVATQVTGRPLTLQLNSAEYFVPWELALFDPPLDPARPKYLAAQVVMGRWILGDNAIAAPPRGQVAVKTMAIMAGMYHTASGLRPLPEAIAEAKALAKTYAGMPAILLDGSSANLKSLLDAKLTHELEPVGGVEAVHFAGHGEVDPTRPGDAALFLNDGKALPSALFRRSQLGKRYGPFIFLNACMVGTGGEILGDSGGFPGNCLAGGFSALVAPLWAVNDEVARSFALEFYQQVLVAGGGRSVAEVLRDLRANYRSDEPVPSYLAYVYYGNPALTLDYTAAAPSAPDQ